MAVRSMTGFSRAATAVGDVTVEVECKSVNHRFLDLSLKVPPMYSEFESEIARLVRDEIHRGRIEIVITRRESALPSYELRFNHALYDSFQDSYQQALGLSAESAFPIDAALQILSRREVLDVLPIKNDLTDEREIVLQVVRGAIGQLIQMRADEGQAILRDLQSLVEQLRRSAKELVMLTPECTRDAQQRFQQRLERLTQGIELDQSRVVQELAILAERTDVNEELQRLESHLVQFERYLSEEESGKKLEFLLQEIGRELNTCGSKVQNARLQQIVVEAKASAERLREQVLNIE